MKKLLLLFLVLAAITACTPPRQATPDMQEVEMTYRGIPVGKEIGEVNLDSILEGRYVIENEEVLSHIKNIGLDEKELIAQFIDSIIVTADVVLRGYVLVYAYNNKISDIVFNTSQTHPSYYNALVKLYAGKYGQGKDEYPPFHDEYFDSRGNKWQFVNATIHIYSFMYHPGKSREYIDMSALGRLNRTEIIYRDNQVHQEVLDMINARRQHEEDSIQHIKDSLKTAYKVIQAQQDI